MTHACVHLSCSDVGAMKGRRGADPNSRTLMSYNIWNYNANWQERKRLIAQFVLHSSARSLWLCSRWRRLTRAGLCVRAD